MTTTNQSRELDLVDLADGTQEGPEWEAWLAAHPEQASEVVATRQMRELLQQLRSLSVEVPADLEVRVLSKVHRASAIRELLNLNLSGAARAALELVTILFSLLPAASGEASPAPRSAEWTSRPSSTS